MQNIIIHFVYLKIYSLGIFFLLFKPLAAQDGFSIYNSYLFDNYYAIHPSIAGLTACSKLRFISKQQWTGSSNDTPTVYAMSYHGRVKSNIGLGVFLFKDKNGPTHQTGANLTYAYSVSLGKSGFSSDNQTSMSFSLSYQGLLKEIKTNDFHGGDPSDPVLSSSASNYFHNATFSFTFIFNSFFSSFTTNSILPYKNTFRNYNYIKDAQNYRNHFITAGFITPLLNKLSFEPSATLFLYEKIPKKHLDIYAKFYYQHFNFEPSLTLGYRALLDDGFTSNLLSIIFVAKHTKWIFGYSFDIEIGNIRKYYAPSHKFSIGLNLFCGYFEDTNKCKYLY